MFRACSSKYCSGELGTAFHSCDHMARSPICLRHSWKECGEEDNLPLPMPPQDRWVIGIALPWSQLQGRLIHTSAHSIVSVVLLSWGPGLLSWELQLVAFWFSSPALVSSDPVVPPASGIHGQQGRSSYPTNIDKGQMSSGDSCPMLTTCRLPHLHWLYQDWLYCNAQAFARPSLPSFASPCDFIIDSSCHACH